MYTKYLGPISRKNIESFRPLLEQAARLLQQGQLVAIPTETVYGLAGAIVNEKALLNIYKVKKRDSNYPLPICVGNLSQIKFLAKEIPQVFYQLASYFLPGPLTVILKKNESFSSQVFSNQETIAIRFPSDSIARRLIEMTGCPLAVSSANLFKKPSAIQASHVLEDLNGQIDAIVDGGITELGMESTIISLVNPLQITLLRQGSTPLKDIEKVVDQKIHVEKEAFISSRQKTMLNLKAKLRLFSSWEEMKIYLQLSLEGKRLVMSLEEKAPLANACRYFKLTAENLYDGLRLAERDGYAEILVLCNHLLKENKNLTNRLKEIASI